VFFYGIIAENYKKGGTKENTGKTAHGLWVGRLVISKTKVDEDEGSPFQNGANLPPPCPPPKGEGLRRGRKNRTISGSPPGTPYPSHLSLQRITQPITPASNCAVKRLGVAKIQYVVARRVLSPTKQPPNQREIASGKGQERPRKDIHQI
jgi:hypothetical protein